jgi:hypothetical protein
MICPSGATGGRVDRLDVPTPGWRSDQGGSRLLGRVSNRRMILRPGKARVSSFTPASVTRVLLSHNERADQTETQLK